MAGLALRGVFLGDGDVAAVGAVPGGDAVAPPELTGDAPVADVVHPVEVGLGEALRHEFDLAVLDDADGLLRERGHLHEPLFGGDGLHVAVASVAGADAVGVVLDLDEVALGLKVRDYGLAGLVAVHAVILAAVYYLRVVVEDEDVVEVVPLGDLEVVRVVAGRHLDAAGAEVHLDVVVSDDGYLAAHEGQDAGLADDVGVALVVGVHGDAGVAQHGLGARRGDDEVAGAVGERVAHVPEVARLVNVLDLGVGERGGALGAPVYDAFALVDELFLVEVHEGLAHGAGAGVVHREALALPVAGGAEGLELLDYPVAVLVLPGPDLVEELIAPEVEAGLALAPELFLDLYLRGDACVVVARQPEGGVAVHALVPYEHVLDGLVEGVAEVELARDIRGRDNDGEGLLFRVALGVEVVAPQPHVVDLLFDLFGVVHLGKFSH